MNRKKSVLTIIVFVAASVIIGLAWHFILAKYFAWKPVKPFEISAKHAGLAQISAQLTSGIVGYWKFDDGSGTTAVDSSGSGNNGTLVNGPVWTNGMVGGGALSFNGTNSYVDFGDKAAFKFTNNDFSISLWFKTSTTSIQALVSKGTTSNAGGANYIIQLNFPSKNTATVWLGNSACNGWLVVYDLTTTFVTDQWTHIVVTKSGTAAVLYKNGVQVDTYTLASDTLCNNSAPLRVGTISNGGQYLLGLTDELRIYNRALNASEVTELYNYGSPDLNPPTLSNGSPTGTLAAGTAQTTLSVTTNENATCRYSTTAGTPYASMTNTFSTTGGVSHSTTISGLADGTSYNYYIRCQDTIGNVNPGDYAISFSLGSVSAPIISGVGTPQVDFFRVKITWTTDRTSDSQVEYGFNTAYGSSTATLSKLDTNHVMVVSALAPNTAYHYRVKSRDVSGNLATSNDFIFTTSAPLSNNLDRYGGDPLIRGATTGFFHLEKIANHWLLIDPLGNAYWFIGPARAGVSAKGTDPTTGKTSGDYINAKYNNSSTLHMTQDKKRLWSWGFTGIGMYESPIIRSYRDIWKRPVAEPILPHFNTRRFANKALSGGVVKNLTNELPNGGQLPDVFDPAFRTSAFNTINQTASGDGLAAEASSPWVIGWITDESDDFTGMNDGRRFGWTVLATAPYRASGTYFGTTLTYADTKVYTKFTLQSFLQARYNNITAINTAWGSNYTTWDSNGGWGIGSGWLDEKGTHSWVGDQNTLAGETTAMQKDLKDFVAVFMKQYYQTVYDAIRSVDTNHMIFGPVAGGSVNSISEIFLGAKDYVDGLFIQGVQDLSSGNSIVPYKQMGRPFFACCSFISAELDSPLAYLFPSWAGGGAPPGPTYFNTQEQRGQYYAQFINKIVNLKDADQTYPILGFHWWEQYDDLSEKRNYGYDSFRDNAYDGFENIMATSTDQWGYVVGGEDKNYGNFLGFAIAATKGAFTTLEQITAGITPPPLDVTLPTVAITSPAQGSTLSDTVTLSASASDNVAVKSVQFEVDGALIGSPITASPYTYSFDTKTLSNGSHSLSALAKDASWNTATALSISVTVSNQAATTTPPPATPPTTSGGGITQTPSTPTISTTITAQPQKGAVPLKPTITASVSGSAQGTVSYTFFCNRSDASTNISRYNYSYDYKFNNVNETTKSVTCSYSNAGTYTAKVITERGSAPPSEARVTITVLAKTQAGVGGGVTTSTASEPRFKNNLSLGSKGDDVTALQSLLIKEGVYPEALVTGYYGNLTTEAVKRLQTKYNLAVSGSVDQPTLNKINQLSAQTATPQTGQQVLTKSLYRGLEDPQVTLLQQLLVKEGVYKEALVTGYFGPLTERGVQQFQIKYSIVSGGNPQTTGFGVVGPRTRAKLNEIAGK